MRGKMFNIAGMACPNNVFVAPLAGYTNYPFRKLCTKLGAGLTFTEMVSAKGLHYRNDETEKLLLCGEESPKAAQIFGSDPLIMREACEGEKLAPFDLIDINMGCPVPKVVKNGEGSALLENLPLAEKIVSECAKSGKRISVKFRIGYAGKKFAAEIAKRMEGAGACLITVHGRLREKMYAGDVDYREIAAAKNAVKIPVIANGGIFSREDMARMIENTGADGVMLARAVLHRPNLIAELTGHAPLPLPTLFTRQLEETLALYGERFTAVFMRKMGAFYVKGRRDAAEVRFRFMGANSSAEVLAVAQEVFSDSLRG